MATNSLDGGKMKLDLVIVKFINFIIYFGPLFKPTQINFLQGNRFDWFEPISLNKPPDPRVARHLSSILHPRLPLRVVLCDVHKGFLDGLPNLLPGDLKV